MPRKRYFSGSKFEKLAGYCRAIADGRWIFVSGTTGFDFETMAISGDPAEQAEQCFRNIRTALTELGGSLEDMVRIRVFIANSADSAAILEVVERHCRDVLPTNTTIVSALMDPAMKVEIEVTALRQDG